MLKRMTVGTAVAALAAMTLQGQVSAQQQAPRRAVGGTTAGSDAYPTDEQYRNSKEAQALVKKAFDVAGTDWRLQERFEKSCGALGPQRPALIRQNAGLPGQPARVMEPVKVFDNMYFIGYNTISAWVIPTSQGILMIDALNSEKDAIEVIEPSLKKLGLNPADVKTIIVGHGHFDHFGGAPYFQQKYKTRIALSKIDWDLLERPNPNATAAQAARPLPKRDIELTDGQKVTLGNETITVKITPGHTAGTLAYYIPVKDHGRDINVLMLSGANITPDRTSLMALNTALDYAKETRVQALINGHPDLFGNETGWMEQIRENPRQPNPFVMSPDQFARFADIMKYCAESRLVALDYKGTN